MNKILKYQKVLQNQYKSGSITKKEYNNELNLIRQIKKDKNDRTIKTNTKTTIQMDQVWCRTTTPTISYQFRENRTR